MSTNLTRRTALLSTAAIPTALAGAAAGTLIPVAGLAQAATTPNATDAAWAEYQAAKAEAERISAASDAFDAALEARLPAHLKAHTRPDIREYARHADFKPVADAWNRDRDAYGVNPYDHDGGPFNQAYDRVADAEDEVLAVPAVTMVDVERKLIAAEVSIGDNGDSEANAAIVRDMLADVRRINGRAA